MYYFEFVTVTEFENSFFIFHLLLQRKIVPEIFFKLCRNYLAKQQQIEKMTMMEWPSQSQH